MFGLNQSQLQQQARVLAPYILADVALVLLAGPFLLLMYPLQHWVSQQVWDAHDRWKTIWCFAFFGWLLCLLLLLFHVQFVQTWQQVALLGPASFSSLRFRTFLGIFLIPTATLLLERLHPRTCTALIRVQTAGDILQSQGDSPSTSPVATPAKRKKKASKERNEATSPGTSRPGTASKRDRRPPGEALYEEKQHRGQQEEQMPVPPEPSQPEPKTINWDEGEGTYREK